MIDQDVMPGWATFFHNQDLAVHWLKPNTKQPIGKEWQKKPVASLETLLSEYQQGNNLGFRPGIPSTINGKCLVVLDVDMKSTEPRHREEAMAKLHELIGADKKPNVLTGGGGMHFYILCDESDLPTGARKVIAKSSETMPESQKPAWAIEILSTGSNCVLPPSVHPETGNLYVWQNDVPFIDGMPEGVREILAHKNGSPTKAGGDANMIDLPMFNLPTPETEENITKLKDALSKIPPCLEYNDWIKVLFSINAHGWQCGEALASEWSATCFEKYDDGAFSKAWNSDKASHKEGRLIGTGTVYHMAKEYGWKPASASDNVSGDTTNGRLFAQYFRGRMLHCFASKKWLRWDGNAWRWCDSGEDMQAATWVADRLVDDAMDAFKENPGSDEAKRKQKAASSLHGNEKRLQAMLNMAASEEGMGIASVAELDKNPMLLGVSNGVVDLETGRLLPASPEYMITRQANAAYYPEAQCPKFLGFLNQTFAGDQEIVTYLQRAFGYTMTGLVDEEVLFFMFGFGANGKSVLANIIAGVMGDYAITANADLLAKKQSNANAARGDIARLSGARLVLANETRSEDVWDDQMIKTLASRERISARFNYGEAFDFFPTHKLWVRGNHQPGITDDGEGMWRRLHLIGFHYQVSEDDRISDLDRQILAEEAEGILKWMVDGALLWKRHGLNPPISIRQATAQYRKECDLVGEWMEDCCQIDPAAATLKAAAYRNHKGWVEKSGMRPITQKRLSRQLKERGFPETYQGGKAYSGFRLNDRGLPMMSIS